MNEFEKIIIKAVEKIPGKFKEILDKNNIKLIPREKPPQTLKQKYGNSIVFGLFAGIPINKKSVFNIETEPTRIELYKESFEAVFRNNEEMEEQIMKTVVHEIGHYFGFSEKDLRKYSL